ncbi:MAG: LysE family transporter, partial [Pseudomonadota bacterium]
MDWSSLAAFNLALLVAIASPGPSFLFLTRQTLARGRAVGLRTALGLGTMAALWTLMALLGLDRLFAVFPWVYGVMTLGGAIYLISIAVRTWRNAEVPVDDEAAQRGTQGAFLSGML